MAAPTRSTFSQNFGAQGTQTQTAWNAFQSSGPDTGELILIAARIDAPATTTPTISTPTGYTLATLPSGTNPLQQTNRSTYLFHKTSNGSESPPLLSHTQGRCSGIIQPVSNWNTGASPFDASATTQSTTGSTTVGPITTTGADRLLLHFAFARSNIQSPGNFVPTAGWSDGLPDEPVDVSPIDYNQVALYQATRAVAGNGGAGGTKTTAIPTSGASAASIFIAISPQNVTSTDQPPTAHATTTNTVIRPGGTTNLDASTSTDDNPIPWSTSPPNPVWSHVSGPTGGSIVAGPFGPVNSVYTAPTDPSISWPQNVVKRVTVADSIGQTSTADVTIRISQGPIANAGGNQNVSVGGPTTITLSGSGTAPTGATIASYSWAKVSGPTITLNNANTATANFSTTSAGVTWVFRLTVTDSDGLTATADATVVTNGGVVTPTGSFRRNVASFTTGATTQQARPALEFASVASGDQQYIDKTGTFPGIINDWTRGGLDGLSTVEVIRILDPSFTTNSVGEVTGVTGTEEPVRFANAVVPGKGDSVAQVVDEEAPLNATVAWVVRSSISTAQGVSFVKTGEPLSAVISSDEWYFSDPLVLGSTVEIKVNSWSEQRQYRTQELETFDSEYASVSSAGTVARGPATASMGAWLIEAEAREPVITLLKSNRTLLLRDPLGNRWYVRPKDTEELTRIRAQGLSGRPGVPGDIHEIKLTLAVVKRPD